MAGYSVEEYLSEDGTSPYGQWFMGLDSLAAAKITTVILKLEQGNLSNVKWLRKIGEFRLDWGPGYRVYFGREGERLIILLGGGTKKGQQRDIDRAEALWDEYKERKAEQQKKRWVLGKIAEVGHGSYQGLQRNSKKKNRVRSRFR